MKSIVLIIKNLKNLLPYFLLIAIYFMLINIETRKDKYNNINIEKENKLPDIDSSTEDKQLRIKIPVIPYSE